MLRSGDTVKIVNNLTEHCFELGEIVCFIGVSLDTDTDIEPTYVFTNGKTEQGLNREDFQLLNT